MEGEQILSVIIMCGCGFGMGALFYWMGHWAQNRKDPMHFCSGSTVDPKTISDIPAYNHANARMWKIYSIPYWLTAVFGLLTIVDSRFSAVSSILIFLACTVGIGWLVWKYNRICRQYMIR